MSEDLIILTIPTSIYKAMVAHARRDAPLECCGLLGGVPPRVSSFHPFRNIEESEVRFEAHPRDLIDAVLALRPQSRHPGDLSLASPREAVPSKTDLAKNYHDDTPQIIISLLGRTPEVRVWRLAPDSYQELPWRVVPDADLGVAIDLGTLPLNPTARPATLPLTFPEDEPG